MWDLRTLRMLNQKRVVELARKKQGMPMQTGGGEVPETSSKPPTKRAQD